jgi:hypothetical protein
MNGAEEPPTDRKLAYKRIVGFYPWTGWFRSYWFWDGFQFLFAFRYKVSGHGWANFFLRNQP